VLLRAGQEVSPLSCEGTLPLFMLAPPAIPVSSHELRAGDRLLFYTDGITERETSAGEIFGVRRLVDNLARNTGRSPADLIGGVVEEDDSFCEGCEQVDDQTILLAAITD